MDKQVRITSPFVVDNVDAVRQLADKPPRRPLVLECAGLTSQERKAWQGRINTLATDCGCSWGAAFLGLAGFAYLLLLVVPDFRQLWSLWGHLAAGAGTAMLGVGAGKAVGLARARRRLRQALWQLARLVEERGGGRKEEHHADLSQVG
jgi:hypothetical protein